MWEDFGKALTNVAFAGVGLAALAAEQVVKAGKVLAEKGEIYVEQGKRYGEELQQKLQEDAQRRREEQLEQRISAMDAQEREALRRRLAELDELERQAREAAAQAEEAAPAGGAEITEIHGGPQEHDSEVMRQTARRVLPLAAVMCSLQP
ncbi:MAG: hypothetical protein ACLURW_07995 [Flavonifractor plautii]